MSKAYKFVNKDCGKVIFNKQFNSYYCGLNQFSHRVGDAKIYHQDSYLYEAVNKVVDKNKWSVDDIEIRIVEASVVSSQPLKDRRV